MSRLYPQKYKLIWRLIALIYIGETITLLIGKYTDTKLYIQIGTAGIVVNTIVMIAVVIGTHDIRKANKKMEEFVRENRLYEKESTIGMLGMEKEKITYYPKIYYKKEKKNNCFYIKIRTDGSDKAEKFRNMETQIEGLFETVSVDLIEERGYITYVLELTPQERIRIKDRSDIPIGGPSEIYITQDIIWDWRKVPHFLIQGETGTGKTSLCQYIIECLLNQGVRVIYCDPKTDKSMKEYMRSRPIKYVTDVNEIVEVIQEVGREQIKRQSLQAPEDIKDESLPPIYLILDEAIVLKQLLEKRVYEEAFATYTRIVVSGRGDQLYAGMLTQRADAEYTGGGSIRDNFECRITMGVMTQEAYKMAFDMKAHNLRREIGSGLILRKQIDRKPREFVAPFIEEGALNIS